MKCEIHTTYFVKEKKGYYLLSLRSVTSTPLRKIQFSQQNFAKTLLVDTVRVYNPFSCCLLYASGYQPFCHRVHKNRKKTKNTAPPWLLKRRYVGCWFKNELLILYSNFKSVKYVRCLLGVHVTQLGNRCSMPCARKICMNLLA